MLLYPFFTSQMQIKFVFYLYFLSVQILHQSTDHNIKGIIVLICVPLTSVHLTKCQVSNKFFHSGFLCSQFLQALQYINGNFNHSYFFFLSIIHLIKYAIHLTSLQVRIFQLLQLLLVHNYY